MAPGVNRSVRPSECPKPGRSTAISRAPVASAGQIRRNASRLSGHGLVSGMSGPLAASVSAYRMVRPSTCLVRVRMVIVLLFMSGRSLAPRGLRGSAVNCPAPKAVPSMLQPPSAASVRMTHVRRAWAGSGSPGPVGRVVRLGLPPLEDDHVGEVLIVEDDADCGVAVKGARVPGRGQGRVRAGARELWLVSQVGQGYDGHGGDPFRDSGSLVLRCEAARGRSGRRHGQGSEPPSSMVKMRSVLSFDPPA